MSEYQYYEFCSIKSPLTAEARKEMRSLSSRAHVSTYGACYVYNYGDFRGKPMPLLLKHFDVFFYIANWGTIRLMFKYDKAAVDFNEINKYCVDRAITCEQQGSYVVLDIHLQAEEGNFHAEGEQLLPDLLPLYDEIKQGNYQFLQLASAVYDEFSGNKENALSEFYDIKLTGAQAAFLNSIEIDIKELSSYKPTASESIDF